MTFQVNIKKTVKYSQRFTFTCFKGPGAYNVPSQKSFGPAITIANRNNTFDQKCTDHPGKDIQTQTNNICNESFYCIEGPGAYNISSKKSIGPAITIAHRNNTFDQKCNNNPGTIYKMNN